MSTIGIILIVIVCIALFGGMAGVGGRPFYGAGYGYGGGGLGLILVIVIILIIARVI